MSTDKKQYVFQARDPSIYCEIYFPHKAAYQGPIYDALLDGRDPEFVQSYLIENIDKGLIDELKLYPSLLNPDLYKKEDEIPDDNASPVERRIKQYRSSFAGWSMYTVAGVFFNNDNTKPIPFRPTYRFMPVEELVQVLRLIFRFSRRDLDKEDDPLLNKAQVAYCDEVYRMIIFRTISRMEYAQRINLWDPSEKARFLKEHEHWRDTDSLREKYKFAEEHYCEISKEAQHWLDDCSLFVFGFLVRKFAQEVLKQEEDKQEEQIWVTHFLDLSVNVTARSNV